MSQDTPLTVRYVKYLEAVNAQILKALKDGQAAICLYHCQTAAKELQGKHIKVCNQMQRAIAQAESKGWIDSERP